MVAGGWHDPEPKGFGRKEINAAIGGSWPRGERVAGIDTVANQAGAGGSGPAKMNVTLEVCRGRGKR